GNDATPGRTRESSKGRRGTGDTIRSNREVREKRNAATVLSIRRDRGRRGLPVEDTPFNTGATMVLRCRTRVTGERRDTETVMRRSERGGWKSAHRGNSLAAYSTARPVRRGE